MDEIVEVLQIRCPITRRCTVTDEGEVLELAIDAPMRTHELLYTTKDGEVYRVSVPLIALIDGRLNQFKDKGDIFIGAIVT
jgi:hypothetical protein